MQKAGIIKSLIEKSQNILLLVHVSPDGDSVGSSLAMYEYLESLGKKAEIISSDKLPSFLKKVTDVSQIVEEKDPSTLNYDNYDLLIALDMNKPGFSSHSEDFTFPENLKVINIDHHKDNAAWGDINLVLSKEPATCSILFKLFKQWEVKVTRSIATNLALGLVSDTGYFKNLNTTSQAFRDMAQLMDLGFDLNSAVKATEEEIIEEKYYMSIIYSNLKVNEKLKFSYSTCTLNEKESKGIDLNVKLHRASDRLKNIENMEFVFFINEKFKEDKTFFTVSFRSVNPEIDVSKFAEKLGGGGHKGAAAAALFDLESIEEAEEQVLKVVLK